MCGIVGIWSVAGREPARPVVERMLEALRHRGPDGQGILQYRGGAAGMVRPALVDFSPRGQQPIWSPDRRVAILYNGEVYNFREERAKLEQDGYPFQSTTDTEVILALYLDKGMDFLRHVRGMYALAIFDWRDTQPGELPTMILVRGPLGIKHLYVAEASGHSGSVVFSSEVRALLMSGLVPREIDRAGLASYLSGGFLLQPKTMIRGVRMLPPGSWERHVPGRPPEQHQYWQLPPYDPRPETLDEAAERLRAVLEESVRLHALADAPVGAFISGGVDSIGVVGLMRKHVNNLRTYTVKFPEFQGEDESEQAGAAARDFGCCTRLSEVRGHEVAQWLPRFAGDLDQPSTDGLNKWVISRAAASDVKAVISGVGGDEWFYGYPVTRRMARSMVTWQGRTASVLARLANVMRPALPGHWLKWKLNNLASRRSVLATWIHLHSVFRPDQVDRMLGMSSAVPLDRQYVELLCQVCPDWRNLTPVGLSCVLDYWVYLRCQLLRDADAVSMAHSLELRVPLVDVEVVNVARTCADEYKLFRGGGSGADYRRSGAKRVLVHALRDVLPQDLIGRRKQGFYFPIDRWMQGPLLPLIEDATNPSTVAARGLIDPRFVAPYFDRRRSPPCRSAVSNSVVAGDSGSLVARRARSSNRLPARIGDGQLARWHEAARAASSIPKARPNRRVFPT